jgi:hypothetical protein
VTDADRLLLAALVHTDHTARAAAVAWLDEANLSQLDEGIRRLLPLLRHRVHGWDLQHAARPTLDRIHHEYWVRDQRLRYRAGVVLRSLASLDGPLIVLKGLLLGRTYYPTTACRPAADIDLMVRPENYNALVARLVGAGYEPDSVTSFHAQAFTHVDGGDVDVHRSPYHEVFLARLVAPIWERRVRLDWPERRELYRLGNSDQLLHTMAHGLRQNSVSPLRWVVDAVYQLREAEQMDWCEFAREAERLEIVEVAVRGAAVLNDVCPGQIPDATIRPLQRARTIRGTRLYLQDYLSEGPRGVWARLARNGSLPVRIARFCGLYLRLGRRHGARWIITRLHVRVRQLLQG